MAACLEKANCMFYFRLPSFVFVGLVLGTVSWFKSIQLKRNFTSLFFPWL